MMIDVGYERLTNAPGGTDGKFAAVTAKRLCVGALTKDLLEGLDRVHKEGPQLLARLG